MSIETHSDSLKREATEFGAWLLTKGCILSEADDAWKVSSGISRHEAVYDTSDGEWLTMGQLYEVWINELEFSWKAANSAGEPNNT